jgi:transglutaminase-like putative cysteine protease
MPAELEAESAEAIQRLRTLRSLRRWYLAGVAAFAVAVCATLSFVWLKAKENERLDAVITALGVERQTPARKIGRLNEWVYHNKGFAKNESYFLLPHFGPTPTDVLRQGGDCSDKSRLLSALLGRAGVDSSLVLLFACADCGPTHTVVEAFNGASWMAVDPTWNIIFPKDASESAFYSVRELRRDPAILERRVADLVSKRGSAAKVAGYPLSSESYTFARHINWEKNAATRAAGELLRRIGFDLEELRRPRVTEDPLALAFITASGFSLVSLIAVGLSSWQLRRIGARATYI